MSTVTATVALGLTRSDRAANYLPSMDGWVAGAAQDEIRFTVEVPVAATVNEIAEAAFEATNAPGGLCGLSADLKEAWEAAGHDRTAEPFRSLSVGDTVVVFRDGRPFEAVQVARFGFAPLFGQG